jgi:hypothetical protein
VEWWKNGVVPEGINALPAAQKQKWLDKYDEVKASGVKSSAIKWKDKIQTHGANTRWGRKTFYTLGVIIVEATLAQVQSMFERVIVQAAGPGVAEISHPKWRIKQSIFTAQQLADMANPTILVPPIDKTHLTPLQIVELVPE